MCHLKNIHHLGLVSASLPCCALWPSRARPCAAFRWNGWKLLLEPRALAARWGSVYDLGISWGYHWEMGKCHGDMMDDLLHVIFFIILYHYNTYIQLYIIFYGWCFQTYSMVQPVQPLKYFYGRNMDWWSLMIRWWFPRSGRSDRGSGDRPPNWWSCDMVSKVRKRLITLW